MRVAAERSRRLAGWATTRPSSLVDACPSPRARARCPTGNHPLRRDVSLVNSQADASRGAEPPADAPAYRAQGIFVLFHHAHSRCFIHRPVRGSE
jgi:hypothetical protein